MAVALADGLSDKQLDAIERATRAIGVELFARANDDQPTVLERRWWDDRIMAWAMRDESVKAQMFRFIDVLPMLDTSEAVTEHLHEYFDDVRRYLPSAARLGLSVARPGTIAGRALAIAARRNALGHARRFIAGTTQSEVVAAAMNERKLKRAFTLDLLGEAVTSEIEADNYLQAYIDLIESIAPIVNRWPEVPQIDRAGGAELPRVNVSIKLSALDSQFDPIDQAGTTRRVTRRLRNLLRVARAHRAFVNIDMESYKTKDLTLAIFKQTMLEDEFRDTSDVGIVIQCYLKDSAEDLRGLCSWAADRERAVWVRLVKGAYWDYETVMAQQSGWPVPVFQEKWQTDNNFEELTRMALANHRHLRTALGSHNLRSLAHGIAVSRELRVPHDQFELQMLYGMGDAAKQAIVDAGYRLRIYMPFGQLIPGMAYLVRRLLENTSNESFLRASFAEHIPVERLMMNPREHRHEARPPLAQHDGNTPRPMTESNPAFRNEPLTDFSREDNRRAMQDAIAEVTRQFGRSYPLVIDGQEIETASWQDSRCPAHKSRSVGRVSIATTEHADAAVRAAGVALEPWWRMGAKGRAEYLRQAAAVMRRRRFELAAWQIFECAKPWREADGDVAEAIDFCEFYALGAERMDAAHGVDVPGEENRFAYVPRGVTAVIAPWNFPLAILTGMTAAALASGNTVVMKPAEQSSVVGAKLMEIFREVGLPPGVLNYVPGPGEIVGAALVEHPDVATIAFTGSRAVGLAINARAAEVSASKRLRHVKHVIAEMGGKNAIIIDDDADLDEAVLGVVKSAFGYQGQKCSACSRVIVLDSVNSVFLERLVEATRSLKIGPAEDPATAVSAVIDEDSFRRIHKYIDLGRQTGTEVLAMEVDGLEREGYYIGPHIFADIAPDDRLAQEEIFGPVLVVLRAANLDEAIRIFNDSDYALTGGIFSRSPEHLRRARRELLVGNLYLNRGITGALVNRQPFGGFKMSGIGTKAGGSDYLLQFVVPRAITENTMRRGFAAASAADEENTSDG
ncbi:MAG TPA: L-glutamate gamma-semialdehyde dehydrogenase [Pirellulales bacterium]|nr:L-glutamate gamma-semialdehyde dehydrogenase [Pirellulales bacterium]